MRFAILVSLIGLALSLIAFGLVATRPDPFSSFDPHRPATLLPLAESRLRELRTAVSGMLRNLVDEFTAPFRDGIRHHIPTQPLP